MFTTPILNAVKVKLNNLGITPAAAVKAITDAGVDTSQFLPGFTSDEVAAVLQIEFGQATAKQKLFTAIYIVLSFLTGLGLAVPTGVAEMFKPTSIMVDTSPNPSNETIDALTGLAKPDNSGANTAK